MSINLELFLPGEVPTDEERCCCIEKDTLRCCQRRKGHKQDGSYPKRSFTPNVSLSRMTVLALVKLLTGEDIKRLSGIDDVPIFKRV